jgi:hypothetical protein
MSSLGASDPGLVPLAELVRGKLERTLAAVP